jgi:acetolactate synthase-1/2/3 large subunit
MKFSTYIVERLKKEGIHFLFGVPGSYIMPIWQASYGHNTTKVVTSRHESGAVFMASGFARIKKIPGVALTTIGPGITNAVTGVAEAYKESLPILLISGQASRSTFGLGAFQESSGLGRSFHPTELLSSVCKSSVEIVNIHSAVEQFEQLFYLAADQRPGPVHLSIPVDIQQSELPSIHPVSRLPQSYPLQEEEVQYILDRLKSAKAPLILVGWGCALANCGDQINQLSLVLKAPLLSTAKGLSAISSRFDYFIGHIGPGVNKATLQFLNSYSPDYILGLGCSFSQYYTHQIDNILLSATIDQVDIDSKVILSSRYNIKKIIRSDLTQFMKKLLEKYSDYRTSRCLDNLLTVKEKLYQLSDIQKSSSLMAAVLHRLNELICEEHILMPDAGNHWLNTLSLYQPKYPGNFMVNTSLGTMGYAISCCIGMSVASPAKKVICITGDASLLMSGNEITVAQEQKLNILFIVFNNGSHGRIRVAQQMDFNGAVHGTDIAHINFSQWAASFGMLSDTARDIIEFETVMAHELPTNTPFLLEVCVDKNEIPICLQ